MTLIFSSLKASKRASILRLNRGRGHQLVELIECDKTVSPSDLDRRADYLG
jgi:hypothetical protein